MIAGFIIKVKKILESICVNCGKLKADIVSGVSFSLLASHPTTQIFWGLSPIPMENPKPTLRQLLDNRVRSSTRGVADARFRSLDRRVGRPNARCWLDTRWCGEMGAERGVRKTRTPRTVTLLSLAALFVLDCWAALAVSQFEWPTPWLALFNLDVPCPFFLHVYPSLLFVYGRR